MPLFSAVAHHQHAVVHMAGACVVPVHSCGSTKQQVYISRFTQIV